MALKAEKERGKTQNPFYRFMTGGSQANVGYTRIGDFVFTRAYVDLIPPFCLK